MKPRHKTPWKPAIVNWKRWKWLLGSPPSGASLVLSRTASALFGLVFVGKPKRAPLPFYYTYDFALEPGRPDWMVFDREPRGPLFKIGRLAVPRHTVS